MRAVLIAAAAALIGSVAWSMHRSSEEKAAAWANQLAAARIDAARAHMGQNNWDEAVRILEETRAMDRPAQQEDIAALLEQAQSGQADALLIAAREATLVKNPSRALQLLRAYCHHPRARDRKAAELLEQEIQVALSEVEARRWLSRLSDSTLAQVAAGGEVPVEKMELKDPGAQALFLVTARGQLPAELRRREKVHEAAQRQAALEDADRRARQARLRSTAELLQLAAFVAQARHSYQEQSQVARRQEQALKVLYRQLNLGDPAQQEEARRVLLNTAEEQRTLEDSLAARRAEARQAGRRSGAISPADLPLFDELVDAEVDALLREMGTLQDR